MEMLSEVLADVPSAYLRNDPNSLTTCAPVSGAFFSLCSHASILRGNNHGETVVGVLGD